MEWLKALWADMARPVRIAVVAVVLILIFALFNTAFAQQRNCGPRDAIVARLAERYGETLQSRGVTGGGSAVMEVFANLDTGTFTVAMSNASGLSCMVAAGEGFQHMDARLEPSGLRL